MSDRPFEPVADAFLSHYETLMGRARTHVVHHHLLEHLAPPPSTVVDVGGGAGHQSLPLAVLGHQVTIAEPASVMLEEAARAVAAMPADAAARVHLVPAPGEALTGRLGAGAFDAALCHGVLGYVADPDALVAELCALLRPGGVVSIVHKQRRAQAMRPAMGGDWRSALAAFDTSVDADRGLDTRSDDVEPLGALLAEHGVDVVAWYGVRLFSEWWAGAAPDGDALEAALAVELEASRRDPYRQVSRLMHVVGRRR